MVALGPFGHRSYSGDHGQRRPETELDEIDGRRREGEGRGHGEDPLLTRNSTEGSVRAEEAERRRNRARAPAAAFGAAAAFFVLGPSQHGSQIGRAHV